MQDGTKEFVSKLTKEQKDFILKLLHTPIKEMLRQIKDVDWLDKKELVDHLHTFQKIHKQNPTKESKSIIEDTLKELEKVDSRIKTLKEVLKG